MLALQVTKPLARIGDATRPRSRRLPSTRWQDGSAGELARPRQPSGRAVGTIGFADVAIHPQLPADRSGDAVHRAPHLAGVLQAKLRVGSTNDPLEHEADRIADAVLRMPAPVTSFAAAPLQISRKCAACADEEALQTKPARTGNPSADARLDRVEQVLRSSGAPLDAATRTYFEPRFRRDLGRVRLHTGALAEQSAADVDARAYTVGPNVVLGPASPGLATPDGRRLLAHELTHVVQQTGEAAAPGAIAPTPAAVSLARQPAPAEADPDPRENVDVPDAQEGESEGGSIFNKPPSNLNATPAVRLLPGGRPANENAPQGPGADWRPDPNIETGPTGVPDTGESTNLSRGSRLYGAALQAARLRYRLESTPRATVDRGGSAPDFVTVSPKPEYYDVTRDDAFVWDQLPQGSRVQYTPRYFHILDAIDHDIDTSTSDDEDIGVALSYVPELLPEPTVRYVVGPPQLPRTYKMPSGPIVHPRLPDGAVFPRIVYDIDLPSTLNDRVGELLEAEKRRARRRQKIADRAARKAELEEAEKVVGVDEREEGPCTSTKVPPPEDNAYQVKHNEFARHVAETKGFGKVRTELRWETPEGVRYDFDTYNPKRLTEVWEVKTAHEWVSDTGLATAPERIKGFKDRIARLDRQRLRGIYVANRCELNFRYAVDNCELYTGLRQQWPMQRVEYIPPPGETIKTCL